MCGATVVEPLTTRDAVARDTPARSATLSRVGRSRPGAPMLIRSSRFVRHDRRIPAGERPLTGTFGPWISLVTWKALPATRESAAYPSDWSDHCGDRCGVPSAVVR